MAQPAPQLLFQAKAAGGSPVEAQVLAERLRRNPAAPELRTLAAIWIHAAVAQPEILPAVWDATAAGWLGAPPAVEPIPLSPTAPELIPDGFWTAFWALVEEGRPLDAGEITARTAALSGHLPASLAPRLVRAALAYPGCAEAAAQGYPAKFTLEALARCPPGSLGGAFHALIVDNGFDLEVLDREALGLADMPPPLDYLNARILQCHDLWHIVGGYRTTALHEVAISAFQMGQFGHHYSSVFLGMALTGVAVARPEGAPLMLDTMLTAWKHGRETPPLLGVDWPAVWDFPENDVRATLGVTPYVSPWPADLFEQLTAAA